MATTTKQRTKQGAALPPEPWGWKMRRGREQVAGLTTQEVVEKLSRYVLLNPSTISRLEKLDEVPTDRRRRLTAYLCAVIYGLDPAQFGLGPDDAPPGIREQVMRSTKWYNEPSGSGPLTLRAA